MEINKRIKKLRQELGINQVKLARRLAVASSYVSEIESGIKKVNERTVRLIIAMFNVNEEWLRNGKGKMFDENYNATIAEAVVALKTLDKEHLAIALKMLSVLEEANSSKKNTGTGSSK